MSEVIPKGWECSDCGKRFELWPVFHYWFTNTDGAAFVQSTMFSFHGGGANAKHRPLPIYQAVEWANSGRGEWQHPGAADGCMRHGLCETSPESPATGGKEPTT